MNGHMKNAYTVYRPYGRSRHTEDGQKLCNVHISLLMELGHHLPVIQLAAFLE